MHIDNLKYEEENYEGLNKNIKTKVSSVEDSILKREHYSIGKSKFLEFYMSEDYENYIIQYNGDILKALEPISYARGYAAGQSYFAAIAVRKGKLQELLKAVPQITNIEKSYPFTLSDLKIVNEGSSMKVFTKKPEFLNGEGVIVGVIGTGIDYLSDRFMTQDGRSRVLTIWDQTIQRGPTPETLRYGTVFSKDKIQEAIRLKKQGGDPYTIVSHKDETGHGTAIAGIMGATNLGPEDEIASIAHKCEFAIVKLKEAKKSTLEINGVSEELTNIYESTDVAAAIEYLALLQERLNKPMVVYLPIQSNCGGHDGQTAIERHIDIYNMRRGFVVTCNTGNEGDTATHTSGILAQKGDVGKVSVEIGEKENKFCLSIWITRPDKISMEIISPTGEKLEKIQVPKLDEGQIEIKLGESTIVIQYFIQEQSGGEQVIILMMKNIKGGIWQLNLIGEVVVNGRYDVWMHQRELLKGDSRFVDPDPYTTLTIPSSGRNILCTGYYDRKDTTLVAESGKGYTRDGRIKPTVVIGGTNILTTGLNNSNIITSGSAVAGAILTGAVALLLQWGIVNKNDTNLYASKIYTYLIRGTIKKEGIVHPNPDWGYGILTCEELFKNLGRLPDNITLGESLNYFKSITLENMYFNIPCEVYRRLII